MLSLLLLLLLWWWFFVVVVVVQFWYRARLIIFHVPFFLLDLRLFSSIHFSLFVCKCVGGIFLDFIWNWERTRENSICSIINFFFYRKEVFAGWNEPYGINEFHSFAFLSPSVSCSITSYAESETLYLSPSFYLSLSSFPLVPHRLFIFSFIFLAKSTDPYRWY